MSKQLTQKERMHLEDQKKHEQVCIQKYQKYAGQAQDSQLKQLFTSLAGHEQQHYNTLSAMLSGQTPSSGQSGASASTSSSSMTASSAASGSSAPMSAMSSGSSAPASSQSAGFSSASSAQQQSGASAQSDASLCTDMLMTEKYVSGAYDTAIFEFSDANMRQELNHIQSEEQQHGEQIYQYMQNKGLYNTQS